MLSLCSTPNRQVLRGGKQVGVGLPPGCGGDRSRSPGFCVGRRRCKVGGGEGRTAPRMHQELLNSFL